MTILFLILPSMAYSHGERTANGVDLTYARWLMFQGQPTAPPVAPLNAFSFYYDTVADELYYSSETSAYAIFTGGAGYTDLIEFVDQNNWKVFYSDGSGDVTELALGADGTYLKSNGADQIPSFATPAGAPHDAVTLSAGADTMLSLSTQEIQLDATLGDTEIFIGTGAGTGNYAALGGDVTMTNAGLVAIGHDALDDQYYDSEGDLTTLLDDNYAAVLGADENYVSDAELVVLQATSGSNTGDNTVATTGDAAVDFFGAGVDAVTDATTCTDIEGTGLLITTNVLNFNGDYSTISGNDGATDVTAAQLEELTDASETTLHSHAADAEANNLETIATGVLTTEIFVGNANDDGIWTALSGDVTMDNTGAVDITQSVLQDGGTDELAITAGMMNTGTNASASTYWRGDNTWVTPSGIALDWIIVEGTTYTRDVTGLDAAETAAGTDGYIWLTDGAYDIDATWTVSTSGQTWQGGRGAILRLNNSADGAIVVNVTGDRCVFRGFTIDGDADNNSNTNWHNLKLNAGADYNIIENIYCYDSNDRGLLSEGSFNTIRNNYVVNCGENNGSASVYRAGISVGGSGNGNIVVNNQIEDCITGISVVGAENTVVSANHIEGTYFDAVTGGSSAIHAADTGKIILTENVIWNNGAGSEDNGINGIFVSNNDVDPEVNIETVVANNHIVCTGVGVEIQNGRYSIMNNYILCENNGDGTSEDQQGIYVGTDNIGGIISGNQVYDSMSNGIVIGYDGGGSNNAIIQQNIIGGAVYSGIAFWVDSPGTMTNVLIAQNYIYDNGKGGILYGMDKTWAYGIESRGDASLFSDIQIFGNMYDNNGLGNIDPDVSADSEGMEIPHGATIAIDYAGALGIDTTRDTLNFYTDAEFVLTPISHKSITLETPTSSENVSMFYTDEAITITKIVCIMVGSSPSVDWNIEHGTDRTSGTDVLAADDTTTSTTTGDVITSFSDATIVADSFVWLTTSATSGTVTNANWTIFYKQDPQ